MVETVSNVYQILYYGISFDGVHQKDIVGKGIQGDGRYGVTILYDVLGTSPSIYIGFHAYREKYL
jgi:hypothetical protein